MLDRAVVGEADPYEYRPLRLPPGTSRSAAREVLSLYAHAKGWELARLALHPDGTRQVVLRRRRTRTRTSLPDA